MEFNTIQCNLDKHYQLEANYIQLNLIIQNPLIRGEAIAIKETPVYWDEKKVKYFKAIYVLLCIYYVLFLLYIVAIPSASESIAKTILCSLFLYRGRKIK